MARTSELGAGGSYFGVQPPKILAGKLLWPPHLSFNGVAALSITASRYYVAPFHISRPMTFAGVKFKQNGNLSGQKIKIAFYNEAAAGGPGTLAKNFGEATLGGATAINTVTSSWGVTTPGWYYGELAGDSASSLFAMANQIQASDVGYAQNPPSSNFLSPFATEGLAATVTQKQAYVGDYVGGTYANFPEATSLTPATSIFTEASFNFPGFCLYV
jgi:hypothetical protein